VWKSCEEIVLFRCISIYVCCRRTLQVDHCDVLLSNSDVVIIIILYVVSHIMASCYANILLKTSVPYDSIDQCVYRCMSVSVISSFNNM